MPVISGKSFTQLSNLNILDEFRIRGVKVDLESLGQTEFLASYTPTTQVDTVDKGVFTPGVDSVSNPTVATVGTSTFSASSLIEVSETINSINNGIYEVLSHVDGILTVRGVGTVPTIEKFTNNDFISQISSGSIARVNASIIQTSSDGLWEAGLGDLTPISYSAISLVANGEIQVYQADDIENMATAGVITVTERLILSIKVPTVTISSRFVLSGGSISIVGSNEPLGSSLVYSGSDTFISGSGSVKTNQGISISSSSTGTLFDLTSSFVVIVDSFIVGWDDLGSLNSCFSLSITGSVIQDFSSPIVIDSTFGVLLAHVGLFQVPTGQNVIEYSDSLGVALSLEITGVTGSIPDTSNLIRIDDNTIESTGILISSNVFSGGSIFDQTGINQKDPRVISTGNPSFVDSKYIGCVSVNDNSEPHGPIVNNTFTDMVFGTVGDALEECSNIERFDLIDDVNGTIEYTGLEPFDGSITYDFSVVSSGGSVEFRFKWQKDSGSGFVDLEDNIQSLADVAGSASTVAKVQPLVINTGERIKPQITRNTGSSGITVRYATVNVTQ